MKLSAVKKHLNELETLRFKLPDGTMVPSHFHVTEVGKITKQFIDCGGTIRSEQKVSFQLWTAEDFDHHLEPKKFLKIISLAENSLVINENLEVEVEYQGQSIEVYGLDLNSSGFLLTTKFTDCLAQDKCGIPQEKLKPKIKMSELQSKTSCSPGSGCC